MIRITSPVQKVGQNFLDNTYLVRLVLDAPENRKIPYSGAAGLER